MLDIVIGNDDDVRLGRTDPRVANLAVDQTVVDAG